MQCIDLYSESHNGQFLQEAAINVFLNLNKSDDLDQKSPDDPLFE
jgi:hypothetical protein